MNVDGFGAVTKVVVFPSASLFAWEALSITPSVIQ